MQFGGTKKPLSAGLEFEVLSASEGDLLRGGYIVAVMEL